jgi:putative ABC transport system substrate-binding protein
MQRRQFIALLGGAAAAWPFAARAQQPAVTIIGFLSSRSSGDSEHLVTAFRSGLKETGYVEGDNAVIAFRWAEGRYDRLPAQAAELARQRVPVIVAAGGNVAAFAAKAATSTIPIVFVVGSDPVRDGLVASLARPGANITGVTLFTSELGAKRLGLLRELVPTAAVIAVLRNPSSPAAQPQARDVEAAARAIGQRIILLNASNERELESVFATLAQAKAGGIVVMPDPFFTTQRERVIALASRHAVPAVYESREYALAGGLMSYGTRYADTYRQAGVYTGRILKGAKPTDLPVLQPTSFELVINLKAAKALSLDIPATVLARADEVIE